MALLLNSVSDRIARSPGKRKCASVSSPRNVSKQNNPETLIIREEVFSISKVIFKVS